MAADTPKDDKRITDWQVRNLKGKLSEPADKEHKRGFGTLLFERRPSGVVEAYFRQRVADREVRLKLGVHKKHPGAAGLTLAELRSKANEYAQIAATHGDVKAYLDTQQALAAAERAERQRQAELDAARGSCADLFLDYIEGCRGRITPESLRDLERRFNSNLLTPHPHIMQLKARDIRSHHILELLNPIWERGAKVQADRMRAYLVAAFNYGLTIENVVGRSNAKIYGLEFNPAATVKVEKVSTPVERALSDAELRRFWQTLEDTPNVGPIMALLFKFVIATGGQRIKNIIETTWADYDLTAGTVRLMHRKGRGGQLIGRPHLVPLSPRALALLDQARAINGGFTWPWTTTGRLPIAISSPKNTVGYWLSSAHALIEERQTPPFTPRDLRRTCTQLMQKHGVEDRLSDLLQAHGQTGVVAAHYRNNPEAALPEKRKAMRLFEQALASVLGDTRPAGDNVIHLPWPRR